MAQNSNLPAVSRRKELQELLERPGYKARLAEVLRDRAPQFAAALVQIVGKSYQLAQCKPESVIGSALTAAALDLSIDPNLGEAHLVPYGENCQFQIGYKGFVQLGLRSSQFKRLGWMVIHKGELVKWDKLSGELEVNYNPDLSHIKGSLTENNEVIGYAAQFTLLNGFERAEYWPISEVREHARRYSQAVKKGKQDSPWFGNFDAMALKTVLKTLINHWAPKSIQMRDALVRDGTIRADINAEPEYPEADDAGTDEAKKPEIMGPGVKAPVTPPKSTERPAEEKAKTAQEAPKAPETQPTQQPITQQVVAEQPQKSPESEKATTEPTTPKPSEDEKAESAMGLAPSQTQEQPPSDPGLAPNPNDTDGVKSVKLLAQKSEITWEQLRAWLIGKKLMKPEQKSLNELASSKIDALCRTWISKSQEIKAMR